jgi:hypothetical protein
VGFRGKKDVVESVRGGLQRLRLRDWGDLTVSWSGAVGPRKGFGVKDRRRTHLQRNGRDARSTGPAGETRSTSSGRARATVVKGAFNGFVGRGILAA